MPTPLEKYFTDNAEERNKQPSKSDIAIGSDSNKGTFGTLLRDYIVERYAVGHCPETLARYLVAEGIPWSMGINTRWLHEKVADKGINKCIVMHKDIPEVLGPWHGKKLSAVTFQENCNSQSLIKYHASGSKLGVTQEETLMLIKSGFTTVGSFAIDDFFAVLKRE